MKRKLGFLLVLLLMICLVGSVLTACPAIEPGSNKYTVKYDKGNSAAKGTTPIAKSYTVGEKITVAPADTFTLAGHDFGGWTDGNDDIDANSEYIMPAKDVVFTAKWIEYDEDAIGIVYDANGGTGILPTTKHYDLDEDFIVAGKGNLARNGYVFLGWTDGLNNFESGDECTIGDYVTNLAKQDGQITLKARWRRTADYDIQGHWINGTALSGPLHNHESHVDSTYGTAEVEEYYTTSVSIKYWDNTKKGKNHITMVVYSSIRIYDEEGTFKGKTANSHNLYDLERLTVDGEYVSDDIYVLEQRDDEGNSSTTKVVFEDKRVKVWFGIPNGQESAGSYLEFDEQKALGKSETSLDGLYACQALLASFDFQGYNSELEMYEGLYIANVWVPAISDYEMVSFYVAIEYLGEYILGYLNFYDEATGDSVNIENVFWYDANSGAVCTFGGVKSFQTYKFVRERQ